MTARVVSRVATCHLTRDTGAAVECRVTEHAVLSDGSRLLLTDDRGWGSSVSTGGDLWRYLTVERVERDVRNVVLPDDAEETGESYENAKHAGVLALHGIATTAEELAALPYDVVLAEPLLSRLGRP